MFDRVSRLERRFRRIGHALEPLELQAEEPVELLNLEQELFTGARSHRFLGYYSEKGILTALEAYGILPALRDRGIPAVTLRCLLDDPSHHRMLLYRRPEAEPDDLLVDLALHVAVGTERLQLATSGPVRLLVIDWLMLQDPRLSSEVAQLFPGQRHPGLGLGLEFGALLGQIARRLALDGLLTSPAWFHNASFYQRRYRYLNPVVQGAFEALQQDLAPLDLVTASWAVELGCVLEHQAVESSPTGQLVRPFHWLGRPMLWAHTPQVGHHFERPAWRGARDAMRAGVSYSVDWERLHQLKPGLLPSTLGGKSG